MQVIATTLTVRIAQLLNSAKLRNDAIEQAKKTFGIAERFCLQQDLLTFFRTEQS